LAKSLTGNILTRLSETRLRIIGAKIVRVSRKLAKKHYAHLASHPQFEDIIAYIQGKPYGKEYQRVLALVYAGENAIEKVRNLAGATNPEKAEATTIRGAYGRVTTKGIFENVIHCSANKEEAEREIKLWFKPQEIVEKIFPTKVVVKKKVKVRVWA
jgi:nucleoside-diphosphate kinase